MELLIIFAVVLAVVAFVGMPLRGRAHGLDPEAAARAELADLEAAKEAKYQEIRDAELDQRTGKLSRADYHVLDAELRAEAIGLLKRIDTLRARTDAANADASEPDSVTSPPAVG